MGIENQTLKRLLNVYLGNMEDTQAAIAEVQPIVSPVEAATPVVNYDVIALNPGHRAWLGELSPELTAAFKTESKDGATIIGIPSEKIVQYLLEHAADEPDAVGKVFEVFYNELKQKIPLKDLEGVKSDTKWLANAQAKGTDQEDIQDAQQSLDEAKRLLSDCIAVVPRQIISLNNLLENKQMKQIIADFIKAKGSTQRGNSSQTYSEYLSSTLGEIETQLARLNTEMQQVLADDYVVGASRSTEASGASGVSTGV